MTATLILYDDSKARTFEPMLATRPLGEVTAGVSTIRERWETLFGTRAAGFVSRPQLVEFEETGAAACFAGQVQAGSIVVNTRFLPGLPADGAEALSGLRGADVWTSGGRTVAVRVRDGNIAESLQDGSARLERLPAHGTRSCDVEGVWLENVWDLVRILPDQIASDIARAAEGFPGMQARPDWLPAKQLGGVALREQASVVGDNAVIVSADASIDPQVVLDARNGPVLISRGAKIQAFSRLEGPLFIGPDSTVIAGRIARSAIGPKCKVAGEMSDCIVAGFANKAHDGFVGHSYLGRWVNIGAGTITSNLKNTYGSVSLWTPGGLRDTGMQFLGSLIGDHARTGIGTMLATGTVIGAGANLFGVREIPPKYVPCFSWGDGHHLEEYELSRFVEVAQRAMARRGVTLTNRARRHLEEVHRFQRALTPSK